MLRSVLWKGHPAATSCGGHQSPDQQHLGFGVPYFNTFFGTCYLKGANDEIKVYTLFPLVTSKPRHPLDLPGDVRSHTLFSSDSDAGDSFGKVVLLLNQQIMVPCYATVAIVVKTRSGGGSSSSCRSSRGQGQ